jgi:hypothetical protein
MARFVNWRNGFWALLLASAAMIGAFIVDASNQDVALKECRNDAQQTRKFLALLRGITVDIAEPRSREAFLELMQRRRPTEFPALIADGSVYVGGLEFVFEGTRLVEIRD